jgi:hypothetical protein
MREGTRPSCGGDSASVIGIKGTAIRVYLKIRGL